MRVGSLHNAIVSSCKAGDNNETIVRVYDASGLEDTVEITFAATMLRAFKTDLLGNVMEELKVENNKVNLKLRGNEIATMKVLF